MSNPIKLAVNRQDGSLVNYNGGVLRVPDLFQGNVRDFQIQFVDPTGSLNSPYVAVDMAAFGLRLAIGDTPTGTTGSPTPLTFQDTWTWDATNKWFTASVNLNVAAVNTFIGTASGKTAYFELTATGAAWQTILQQTFTLRAVVDDTGATLPAPADSYYTKNETEARFQKKVGDAGQRLVLVSANGLYGRELGVNDDGTAYDGLITL